MRTFSLRSRTKAVCAAYLVSVMEVAKACREFDDDSALKHSLRCLSKYEILVLYSMCVESKYTGKIHSGCCLSLKIAGSSNHSLRYLRNRCSVISARESALKEDIGCRSFLTSEIFHEICFRLCELGLISITRDSKDVFVSFVKPLPLMEKELDKYI